MDGRVKEGRRKEHGERREDKLWLICKGNEKNKIKIKSPDEQSLSINTNLHVLITSQLGVEAHEPYPLHNGI